MRKYLYIFFSLITFFSIVLISLPYFIDKSIIKNFIVSGVSNKINKNMNFDDDIDLFFFPKPHITIRNFKVSGKSGFFFQSKEVELTSNWKSLLSLKPKINYVKLISPNLDINVPNKTTEKNIFERNIVKVNLTNIDKSPNNYAIMFDKIDLINGNINLKSDQGNFYFSQVNIFYHKEGVSKNIKGNVRYQDLLSKIEFEIESKEFKVFDLKLRHFLDESKNSLDIDGKLYPFLNVIKFDGNLNSETVDINHFNRIINHLSSFNKKKKIENINISNDLKIFEIFLDSKIKELKFEREIIKDLVFKVIIDDKAIKISRFKAKFWKGNLDLDINYLFQKNNLKGLLLFKDFSIPQSFLGETTYDLVGGNCYFTSKFESQFMLSKPENIFDEMNLIGKLEFKKVRLKGLDTTKLAKNLDQIKNISNIISFLDFRKTEGESLIKNIESDLVIKRGKMQTEDFVAHNDNFFLRSKGEYKIKDNMFKLDNNITFKTKKYNDLPSFSLRLFGEPNNFVTKYDFEDLKNQFLSKGINSLFKNNGGRLKLDMGEIKNLLKKEDSIDLNNVFDLFSN